MQKEADIPETALYDCAIVNVVDVLQSCGHCNACKQIWGRISNFGDVKRRASMFANGRCIFDASDEASDDEAAVNSTGESNVSNGRILRNKKDVSYVDQLCFRIHRGGATGRYPDRRNGYRLQHEHETASLAKLKADTNHLSMTSETGSKLQSHVECVDDVTGQILSRRNGYRLRTVVPEMSSPKKSRSEHHSFARNRICGLDSSDDSDDDDSAGKASAMFDDRPLRFMSEASPRKMAIPNDRSSTKAPPISRLDLSDGRADDGLLNQITRGRNGYGLRSAHEVPSVKKPKKDYSGLSKLDSRDHRIDYVKLTVPKGRNGYRLRSAPDVSAKLSKQDNRGLAAISNTLLGLDSSSDVEEDVEEPEIEGLIKLTTGRRLCYTPKTAAFSGRHETEVADTLNILSSVQNHANVRTGSTTGDLGYAESSTSTEEEFFDSEGSDDDEKPRRLRSRLIKGRGQEDGRQRHAKSQRRGQSNYVSSKRPKVSIIISKNEEEKKDRDVKTIAKVTDGGVKRRLGVAALDDVRQRLQASSLPDQLPCREEEFEVVLNFIAGGVASGVSNCMYISGVPGTGKTATVLQAVHCAQKSDRVKNFKFCHINGMLYPDPKAVFCDLLTQIKGATARKISTERAATLLDDFFQRPDNGGRSHIVLLVDEIDLLVTRNQRVLYRMFEWTTKRDARLSIIAIANTLDFPETILSSRVSSRMGLQRLSFPAYTHKQISEILESRLIGLNGAVDSDAIQLAARKVAAVSGDVRRALEICRLAADIAAKEATHKSAPKSVMSISHIKEALKRMSENPKLLMIRHASEHEKLLLRSSLAEYNRVGLEEFELCTMIRHYRDLCDSDGVNCVNRETIHCCVQNFVDAGLFMASPGTHDYTRRLRFNVNPEDIELALKTA